jgi:putative endopeptidase
MKPKWEQQIDIVNYYLGEQVGKLYVEKYFPVESKNKCLEMVNIMKKELYNYLKNKSWFEEETKIKALEKLNKMNIKIGFPDKYEKDYTKLKISRKNCLLKNILLIKRFNLLYEYDKLYKPNQKLWLMNPQIVNAYYSPNNNEIVFPAAILQEPFFSLEQDMAKNFGGIGCVIGHEITHAFDDEGSKFDADGNLKNWWTEKDKIEYKKITDKLKEQSEQFKLDEGKINGELTLGENIADLGGVNISLNALEHYYKNPSKEIYENFFTNYATVWRFKSTQNSMRKKLLTDPHSPPIFRVNGILKNIDKFDNSTKDKVKIWS